nr:odorant receptor SameORX [Schistocerca americana]
MKSEQEDNRNVAMDFLVTLMHAWALVSRSISGPWLLVHHFYKAIVFICMGSLLVSELIAIGIGGDDMLTLSLNTCVMLSNAVAIYKLVLSTVWPGRYRSLVEHVVRSLPDYLSHDAAGRRRLVADSRTAYTFTMGFVVCGHVTVASWSLLPLLLKPVEKLRLPLVAWTPFDSSCGLGFLVTYVYQFTCTLFMAWTSGATDLICVNVVMQLCSHLEILCCHLQRVGAQCCGDAGGSCDHGYLGKSAEKPTPDKDDLRDQLRRCIRYHQEIISVAREMDSLLWSIVLSQCLCGMSVLCLLLFQMALHTLTIETIAKYLSYMASILLQIFCYCWFGDNLSSKSTAVARVAYSCAWTRGSAGFGRSLCILMARAQRPLIVSGGSFYILSREAFIRILNASYSYFAVLYSMSDK